MQKYVQLLKKLTSTIKHKVYPEIPPTIGEEHTRAHVRRAITKTVVTYTLAEIAYGFYCEYKLFSSPQERQQQRARLNALDKHFKTNGYGGWFW